MRQIKKVINIEDDMYKHSAIARSLKKIGVTEVALATNAEDGIAMIEAAIVAEDGFDLLITDMHFPLNGIENNEAGLYVIKELKSRNIEIPIIVCSSVRYRIDEIAGCIFYNVRSGDLDGDIRSIVKNL